MEKKLLDEIREVNITYLMLAQKLLQEDKVASLFRLGMSEESANLLIGLTSAQIYKISNCNVLLCRFRMDDDMVWGLLANQSTSKVDNGSTTNLHANILISGKFSETI